MKTSESRIEEDTAQENKRKQISANKSKKDWKKREREEEGGHERK